MGKRKNGGKQHQTHSFEQLVANATLGKFSGYIDQQIQGLAQALVQRQAQSLGNLVTRLVALEELMMEKFSDVTKATLADRVSNIEDASEGLQNVTDGGVLEGDRVRLELKTRTADQTEYQGSSRLLVDNAGSGNTLGKEIEAALIGMKAGDSKDIAFGVDNSLAANLVINKISRLPILPAAEVPAPETAAEAEVTEGALQADVNHAAEVNATAAAEEVPNASANAG